MAHDPIRPYLKNAPGDFYVENGCCLMCEAPYQEAPDLMASDRAVPAHCYFRRQPETPEEVERAVKACHVSCVQALRYAGKDPKVLQQFRDWGEEDVCDMIAAAHPHDVPAAGLSHVVPPGKGRESLSLQDKLAMAQLDQEGKTGLPRVAPVGTTGVAQRQEVKRSGS